MYHFLNHTLPANLYYKLKEIGAPQPNSIQSLSFAARFRAARKTITVWRERKAELDAIRDDHAPCGWFHHRSIRSNPWWDTWPAMDLIAEAAAGFNGQFGHLDAEITQVMKDGRRLGLQAAAARVITPRLYNDSFAEEAARRLLLWIPELECQSTLLPDIAHSLIAARGCKPFFVVALIRTWFNGWITSYRAHTSKKTCCFGCNAEDRLLHYVRCEVLWKEIYCLMGSDCIVSGHSSLALNSGASYEGCPANLFALAVAVDAYHNLKSAGRVREQIRDSWRRSRMLLR